MINMNNFTSKDNRTITGNELVGVHWNAHKNVYSIVSMKSRKTVNVVLGYANKITLRDCTTKIDKSKQTSVINTGVKDRHAFIVGYIDSLEYSPLEKPMYYNPHKVSDFIDAESYFKDGTINYIDNAKLVSLDYDHTNKRPIVTYNK